MPALPIPVRMRSEGLRRSCTCLDSMFGSGACSQSACVLPAVNTNDGIISVCYADTGSQIIGTTSRYGLSGIAGSKHPGVVPRTKADVGKVSCRKLERVQRAYCAHTMTASSCARPLDSHCMQRVHQPESPYSYRANRCFYRGPHRYQ